jgi:adenylate cyclase
MDKFTGDGLMAVFGAPVALEDHAIRACLAALDMQTETPQMADEVRRNDGIELQLRVGLNSGQVVAGEIGAGVPGGLTNSHFARSRRRCGLPKDQAATPRWAVSSCSWVPC